MLRWTGFANVPPLGEQHDIRERVAHGRENRNMNFITASSAPPIATDFTQNFAGISVPGGRCNDHTGAAQL
jgi:hypothetical protein